MTIPDIHFFVIGAARSGTTSIYNTLVQHPDVFTPTVKEPRFFNENWDKGWEWFSDLYKDAKPGQLCGDFSPSYTCAPAANRSARLIHEHYPNARLIYMVRNPVECAISNWRMTAEVTGEDEQLTFEEALDPESPWAYSVLHRSLFYKQLNDFREFFDDEQILVVPLELARIHRDQWVPRFQQHLGLEEQPLTFLRSNASDRKPNRPKTPEIPRAVREKFLDLVAEDTQALLAHIGQPATLWTMGPKAKAWTKGA